MKFLFVEYLRWLWLLALLLPLFILFIHHSYHDLKILIGQERFAKIYRRWLTTQLLSYSALLLTLILLLMAASDPIAGGGGSKYEDGQGEGVSISFVLDISRSMLAADVRPQRLVRATEFIRLLVRELPASQYSLVAFKGTAATLLPLTSDLAQLELVLANLSPQLISSIGTAIDSGIERAVETAKQFDNPRSVMVILGDGEGSKASYRRAEQYLNQWRGQLYVVGVGSNKGANIVDQDGQLIRNHLGNVVLSKLKEQALRRLARKHQGYYFNLNEAQLIDRISTTILPLSHNNANDEVYGQPRRYRWFLLGALLSLLLAWLAKNKPPLRLVDK